MVEGRAPRPVRARAESVGANPTADASPPAGAPATALIGANIDYPRPGATVGRVPITLQGWALCAPQPVSRVEISVNNGRPAPARLGVPRPDLEGALPYPEACIGGFEHVIDLGAVSPNAHAATVRARVLAHDGASFDLPRLRLKLSEAAAPAPDPDGRIAQLRARVDLSLGLGSVTVPAPAPAATGDVHLVAFAHSLEVGGAQLWLVELLERLAGLPGFACTVVAATDGPLRRRLEACGIPAHVSGRPPAHDVEEYEARIAELGAWLTPQGHNLALVNTLGCFAGADIAHRLGLPCVWAVHEALTGRGDWCPQSHTLPPHPAVRRQAEVALAGCSVVVVECKAVRRRLRGHVDERRLLTVPPGVDAVAIDLQRQETDVPAARRHLGVEAATTVVLDLAMAEPRTSQTLLLLAWSQISPRHPEARLVLSGSTSAGGSSGLERYVALMGLEGSVRVVPCAPDRPQLYAAADVLVSASPDEPLPRAALEAMAWGVPVVAAAESGLSDILTEDRTGWLVDAGDLRAVEAGIERALAAGPETRAAVAGRARALVRTRFPVTPHTAFFDNCLRSLIATPGTLPDPPPPAEPAARAASWRE